MCVAASTKGPEECRRRNGADNGRKKSVAGERTRVMLAAASQIHFFPTRDLNSINACIYRRKRRLLVSAGVAAA